jgi:hypothetical protein
VANLLQLLASGLGQPLDAPIMLTSRELTWSERRRVQRLVHRGEAAWDERSARHAVEVARSIERAPSLLGPRASRVMMMMLAVATALLAVGKWSDQGLSLAPVFYAAASAVLMFLAMRSPAWLRNAPRAREVNQALLSTSATADVTVGSGPGVSTGAGRPTATGALASDPPLRRSRRDERLGVVLAVGFSALLFGGQTYFWDDHDLVGGLVGGLMFGLLFVPSMRYMARRAQANARTGDTDPPPPVSAELWRSFSPRVRRALRVVGSISAALLLWIVVMAQVELSTCDTTGGGLAPADQVGFTKSFCGTPGADAAGTALAYALVGVLPLVGLLLGAFAAGWRSGSTRSRLLAVAALFVGVPVMIAWLLAGAH